MTSATISARKYLVIFVIAVLYSAFVFTLVQAIYPWPEHEDFCKERQARPFPPTTQQRCPYNASLEALREACIHQDGIPRDQLGEDGCPRNITCDFCNKAFTQAKKTHALIYFFITALLGALSIIVGLLLPPSKTVNEWIGSGLLLGGLIVIFGGTIITITDLQSYLRPIVLFAELLLVIYLAYITWGDQDRAKEPKEKNHPAKTKKRQRKRRST
ncbi:hypothetical protein D6783_02130 [Candidatus Woesearchaeota archaeon]|nr:MAG: hypothetical protein D6783_02130 [Candidatus Woesearchaeota archaeon]